MSDYFIYNDIDSREFGLHVINDARMDYNISPPKRSTSQKINGRNGELLFEQDYGVRDIDLKCYLTNNDQSNVRMIMSWLGQTGTKELILSYENYKVYTATFENQLNMDIFYDEGIFTLTFRCYDPLAKSRFTTQDLDDGIEYDSGFYYDSGILYSDGNPHYTLSNVTINTNIDIYNGSNVDDALPNIIFDGSATTLVLTRYHDSLRTEKAEEISYGSFSGILEINSLLKNIFLDGDVDNEGSSGEFPNLDGKTNMTYMNRGDIQSISSDTITLDINASIVDDYYNDMVLIVKSGFKYHYYTISDYVGSTKVATISDTFDDEIDTDWEYAIYDPANGMNYFTVSGTGLNFTTVKFDFNYRYL